MKNIQSKFKELLIFIIYFLALLFNFFILTERKNLLWDDAIGYYNLALYFKDLTEREVCSARILTPFLTSILPFDIIKNFYIICFLSIYLITILFFYFLKELGFDRKLSFIGGIFYIFSFGVKVSFTNPLYIDALSHFFIMAGIYFLKKKNNILYSLCLILGLLNKEVTLFLLPSYYFVNRRNSFDLKIFAKFIGLSIFLFGIFFSLNVIYRGSLSGYLFSYLNIEHLRDVWLHHLYIGALIDIYSSFGLLWLLAIFSIKKIDFIRKNFVYGILVIFQLIFAHDEGRLLSYLFPLVIPLSLKTLEKFDTKFLLLLTILVIMSFVNHPPKGCVPH